MSGTLSLLPRYLTSFEKALGISELCEKEFRAMIDVVDSALDKADAGRLTLNDRRVAADILALIATGDSRRVPSVQPGDYSAVYVEGLPVWLVCALQESFQRLPSREMRIAGIIGGKLVTIWPMKPAY